MKHFLKTIIGLSMVFLPLYASAQVASSTMPVPVHISPIDVAALKTASFISVDWFDTFVGSTSLFYLYELSRGSSTNSDGGFVTLSATSSLLTSSTHPSVGTEEGAYFWHVRSVDMSGNISLWSSSWKVIVDNTAPSSPSNLIITASTSPVIVGTTTTTNGSQTWSFNSSVDAGSGVSAYQYTVNSTSSWINNGLLTSFTTTLGTGNHIVAVRALDKAGNISTSTFAQLTVTASSTSATSSPQLPSPKSKHQCKKGGWKNFSNPVFKNQGKCVSYVESHLRDSEREQYRKKSDEKKTREDNRKTLKKYKEEQKMSVAIAKVNGKNLKELEERKKFNSATSSEIKNSHENNEGEKEKGSKKDR